MKKQSRHKQVTAALRNQMLSGELKAGSVLPATPKLAEQFGTSVFTIQTALGPLVAEGLLERKQRVGTVVKHNPAILTTAAIYSSEYALESSEDAFRRELNHQLQRQLAAQNVQVENFLDSRLGEQRREPLPALRRAVESNEVQALLAVGSDQETTPWLQALPIAASFSGGDKKPKRVHSDRPQMLRLGLQCLRDRGCRTVGLICSIQNSPHLTPRSSERDFYRSFISILGELGLTTRDDWMLVPNAWQPAIESYGYNSFKALWTQADHPDGLMVFPDVAARGVIIAALELGVRVPEDVQMVFHRNSGIDIACPLPATWVESDTAAWAAAMIDQVRQQKAGETVTECTIDFRLVENEKIGQKNVR
jgi:DNA-binding LacI/PurR family transcriptional regulator